MRDWKPTTLGHLVSIQSGVSPSAVTLATSGTVPFVKVDDLNNCQKYQVDAREYTLSDQFAVPPDSILFAKRGAAIMVNKIRVSKRPLAMDTNMMALIPNPSVIDSEYLYYFIQSEQLSRIADVSSIPQINNKHINPYPIRLPTLPEQRKIAGILRTWDDAIEACERRGLALRKQFEGLRLRLFEAAYSSDNRTRHAKDLFEAVSEKKQTHLPLLAVMQDIGVVRRDELDRRVVMPDGDVDGYKVVRDGDFVISLRSFEGGLEYSRVTGLVSPAYTVLRSLGSDYIGDYYRHFFKSKSFIGRLDKLIFGIRDGKQIAFRDFGDMKIPNPPRDEQEAAAEALGMAEHQIRLAEQEALAYQQQKRGLMQKLLTGEWRVKVDKEAPA